MNKEIWLLDAEHIKVLNPSTNSVEPVNTDTYPTSLPL